jgi:hypothetical protein
MIKGSNLKNIKEDSRSANEPTVQSSSVINRVKDQKMNRKLGVMVVFMCTISTVSHCFFMSSIIYFYFYNNPSVNLYIQLAEFFNTFKIFLSFFIFYNFNKNFKAQLKGILGFRS